jgi:hypothetical protein
MIITLSFSQQAQAALLADAASRDLTTARRITLLEILWHERYLNRAQLIARVEGVLGKNAFGKYAWEDTFYRDIRAVKLAFLAAGYRLKYRRDRPHTGYYLVGEPPVSAQVSSELSGAADRTGPGPREHSSEDVPRGTRFAGCLDQRRGQRSCGLPDCQAEPRHHSARSEPPGAAKSLCRMR